MPAGIRFDILTLFPEMLAGPLEGGVLGRARRAGLVEIESHNLRDWAMDRHNTVDDYTFGGGSGMVMKPEPIAAAVEALRNEKSWVVLLTPQGKVLDHAVALELSRKTHLILICGRYEGVDERVRIQLVDEQISIGDYVLTGGELPALVLTETVARLAPGVVGNDEATRKESHSEGLLEHPHFTRPREFRGEAVPDVLLSGDHGAIRRWRHRESLRRTLLVRPDLLQRRGLEPDESEWLWKEEPAAMSGIHGVPPSVEPDPPLEKKLES